MTPVIVSEFRKSSYSTQQGDCVEVAPTGAGGRAVRDSKSLGGNVQFHGAGSWETFVHALKIGHLPSA